MEIAITEKIHVFVGLSKFNAPTLELKRLKTTGAVKRLFVSPTLYSMIMDKASEVSAIMSMMNRQEPETEPEHSSVSMTLDDKKSLLLEMFAGRPWVSILTYKDGLKQNGLAFNMDIAEWNAFIEKKDEIRQELTKLQTEGGAGKRARDQGPTVTQYRPLVVKVDGTVKAFDEWTFVEEQATEWGQFECPLGAKVFVQERRLPIPTVVDMRNAAKAALVTKAIQEEKKNASVSCSGQPTHPARSLRCRRLPRGSHRRSVRETYRRGSVRSSRRPGHNVRGGCPHP